jgi:sec-independent protein translocase protein TatA
MFPRLGPTELIIILIIIIVLFGVGRISKIAGELGSGIRSFKDGLQGDEKEKSKEKSKEMGDNSSEDKPSSS